MRQHGLVDDQLADEVDEAVKGLSSLMEPFIIVILGTLIGGIVGAVAALFGFFDHLAWSAALVALPMLASAVLLWRHGVETRGLGLEDIQRVLRAR